ncbi:MAG: Bug family tripartite tricarboxylate transporter substrate binding protein [bacterium]|nr:tripartite tricarboxylate transporter substrate binding protein [Betaproteobacteria bacterium]
MMDRDTCKPLLPALLASLCLVPAAAQAQAPAPGSAQAWPARSIRLVVPQTPGGASDALARIIGQQLADAWGQQVLVDNRPGAGGNIGNDLVAKASPDGYTWLLGFVGTHAINPSLYKGLTWDPQKSFTPLATLASVPFVVAVHAPLPVKNVGDLVALARSKPGEVRFGSAGNGTVNHLLGPMLASAAKVQFTHVPYKGAAGAITDTLSGQVQFTFTSMPSVIGHLKAGSLRAIAVTSGRRAALLKDVPTVAESGFPGFDVTPWFGVLGPAGLPEAVVTRINGDINRLLASRETVDRFAAQGAEPLVTTPAQFGRIIAADVALWSRIVRETGATVD